MNTQVELLVHIGAPSTRRDDEVYAAQARAYLDFQGHTRNDLPLLDGDETTYLDDTQLAYNALDSQLATSSLVIPPPSPEPDGSQEPSVIPETTGEARKEPSRRHRQSRATSSYLGSDSDHQDIPLERQGENNEGCKSQHFRDPPASQPAALTPPAQVDDEEQSQSSYLKSPILDRKSKKRRLNNSVPDAGQPSRYVAPLRNNQPFPESVGQQPHTELQRPDNQPRESQTSNETTSELPTSYSLSDVTSESSRAKAKRDGSQRTVSDPGPRTDGAKAEAARKKPTKDLCEQFNSQVAQSEATEAPERTTEPLKPSGIGVSNRQAARLQPEHNNAVGKTPISKPKPGITSQSPVESALGKLPQAIHPPPPPPGTQPYTTHVTPDLHFLSTRPSLPQTYKPISTTRPLQPLERGYWLLDCRTWPPEALAEFWQFLGRILEEGRAGWGVWCERDDEGMVKVFCWGEVVRHVWLLVYMASKSRVRKCGAVWVDGGGEVVFRMRDG